MPKPNEHQTEHVDISPESSLVIRVKNISIILIIMALFIIGILLIMLIGDMISLTQKTSRDQIPLSNFVPLVFELCGLAFGFFIFKVAVDFRSFKKWTWRWVNLLAISNWGFIFKGDLQREDMRQAFEEPRTIDQFTKEVISQRRK